MLIDTDVLIDVALDRRPHSDLASEVLDRLENGYRKAFIAWHSVSNFFYMVAPSQGEETARDFIMDLTRFVEVAETGTEAIRYAAALPMTDFEAAMQVAAADACGARCIVTRNMKHFRRSPITAISPQEALSKFF